MKFILKISGIAFLVLLFGCKETMTSRYANFQEAKEANLFNRGWVPDVLPENTGEIIETHNIDTNERCSEAVIPADSLATIIADLKLYKFSQSDTQLSKVPFSFDDCQFKVGDIGNTITVLVKANEIVILDGEINKFYYWSF